MRTSESPFNNIDRLKKKYMQESFSEKCREIEQKLVNYLPIEIKLSGFNRRQVTKSRKKSALQNNNITTTKLVFLSSAMLLCLHPGCCVNRLLQKPGCT